jgi:malate dehydrogenase (oxaloacetate-decarboxylating)
MIAQGLSETEARTRFYLVDRNGLLHNGMTTLLPFQKNLAQAHDSLKNWHVSDPNNISLLDVITNANPTVLLGVSGQPKQFTEQLVKAMSAYCPRPIIFPLSNPTSRAEAVPEDLLNWSAGNALIATGSPFDPVTINGKEFNIAQCNNSYIFPGVGLAVVAGQAKRVTNQMMMAAALALSDLAPAVKTGEGRLLPELSSIREVSRHIAKAVIIQAIAEGHVKPMDEKTIDKVIEDTMWTPRYQEYLS